VHEAAIALALIELCEAHLRARAGAKLTAVGVRIGELAGVDPDALTFSFNCLVADTPLAGAVLQIAWLPRDGAPEDAQALDLHYLEVDDEVT
jgi:hydrogenase nickel incorporation protein HypA/HybF